jgi:AcrR family transcriptional regulator
MAIVAAASRLFAENGWSGTGMRDVARAAQVSVEFVYANFGSKSSLLKQALDVATAALHRVLQQGAAAAAELAALLAKKLASQRAQVREGILAVARREITEAEVDAMFAVLSTDVYLLLTETSGWSSDQYESWVAATVARLLDLGED